MDKRYYTTSQAAHLLDVSPDTVLKWVRQGKIACYKTPGGHARIPRPAIEKLLPGKSKVEETAPAPVPYRYCWEFYGRDGVVNTRCEGCVVFRSRARRCYEMRDIPEQFGHLKLHCDSDCEDCDYFRKVRGEGTAVLIVTRNTGLQERIRREARDGDVPIRFVASEYECSTLLNHYRPDYIVLDCALGKTRIQEMCRHLNDDGRIPFTKVILTSGDKTIKDCLEGKVFGWIKKPFTYSQLRCCLGQAE